VTRLTWSPIESCPATAVIAARARSRLLPRIDPESSTTKVSERVRGTAAAACTPTSSVSRCPGPSAISTVTASPESGRL
jgi:hypothetical protein